MTVGEVLMTFDCGGFIDERGFVLGIDMSETHNLTADNYTAVTDGVISVKGDISPRFVIRDYVDGDRAVPLSKRAEVCVCFLRIGGNAVQKKLIDSALDCSKVRCVYKSAGEVLFLGEMLPRITSLCGGDIYGMNVCISLTAA